MSKTIHRLRTTHTSTKHILAGHSAIVEFEKEEDGTYLSEPIPESVAVENAQIPHFALVVQDEEPTTVKTPDDSEQLPLDDESEQFGNVHL